MAKKIVIDPGHGGNDQGTINNGIITDKAISFEKTLPEMDTNKNKIINEANKILFF